MTKIVTLAWALSVAVGFANFCDNCSSFNSTLWSKANWALGRGSVLPADDSAGGGYYWLKIPAHTYNGGEIYTPARYTRNGCASASFKAEPDSAIISALFFYQGVSGQNDEIDIELWKTGGHWIVSFTVDSLYLYDPNPAKVKGRVVYHYTYTPSFDPSAGFHTYGIDWAVGGVTFFVDGQTIKHYIGSGNPSHAMQIHMNCWWPAWSQWKNVLTHSSTKSMQIDWISYTRD